MFKNSIGVTTIGVEKVAENTKGIIDTKNISEVTQLFKEIKRVSEVKQFPKELTREDVDRIFSTENTEKYLSNLKEVEKEVIMKDSGWSVEIVDKINSIEEYKIYKDAGLQEIEIAGKKCLIRNDIDWKQMDEKGRTNTQRMEKGLAPLDKHGEPIELHHVGQHVNSPLAELTFEEHRCNGNDTILHNKTKQTEVHGEGNNWDRERQDYWKNRVEYGGNNNE